MAFLPFAPETERDAELPSPQLDLQPSYQEYSRRTFPEHLTPAGCRYWGSERARWGLLVSSEWLTRTVSYSRGNGFEITVEVARMTCFSVPFVRCLFASKYSAFVTMSMNTSRLG